MPLPNGSVDSGWLANAIDEIQTAAVATGESKLPLQAGVDGKVVPNVVPYAVVPQGYSLQSLEKFVFNDYAERPHRVKADVKLISPASFVEYIKKFKAGVEDGKAVLFALPSNNAIKGFLDYHDSQDKPGWKQHSATLALSTTPEYKAWAGASKKRVDQEEFASFLEENAADILEPSAADLLEKVTNFHSTSEVKFSSVRNLGNGRIQISYSEAETNGFAPRNTELPAKIKVRFSIFEGLQPQEFEAYLRYKIQGTSLVMGYDLIGLERAVRAAFRTVVSDLRDQLQLYATIYEGAPE